MPATTTQTDIATILFMTPSSWIGPEASACNDSCSRGLELRTSSPRRNLHYYGSVSHRSPSPWIATPGSRSEAGSVTAARRNQAPFPWRILNGSGLPCVLVVRPSSVTVNASLNQSMVPAYSVERVYEDHPILTYPRCYSGQESANVTGNVATISREIEIFHTSTGRAAFRS
jgi:hypothetical protein